MSDYKNFLVPFDFSEHAHAALQAAVDLGGRLGADIHLVHVYQDPLVTHSYGGFPGTSAPPVIDMSAVRKNAEQSLNEVKNGLSTYAGEVTPHVVEWSGISSGIVETAKDLGADLIVMGTHGRTGLAHVFLGSVAERTLRTAPCPVLTVQATDQDSSN